MGKTFLEHAVDAVAELVYKFDEKSTASVWKGESTAKVPFKLFGITYIIIYIYTYTHIWMDTNINHITPCSRMCVLGDDTESGYNS